METPTKLLIEWGTDLYHNIVIFMQKKPSNTNSANNSFQHFKHIFGKEVCINADWIQFNQVCLTADVYHVYCGINCKSTTTSNCLKQLKCVSNTSGLKQKNFQLPNNYEMLTFVNVEKQQLTHLFSIVFKTNLCISKHECWNRYVWSELHTIPFKESAMYIQQILAPLLVICTFTQQCLSLLPLKDGLFQNLTMIDLHKRRKVSILCFLNPKEFTDKNNTKSYLKY